MTAVHNTLEETMTKQEEEAGYGAIVETNNPETKKNHYAHHLWDASCYD